MIRVKRVTPEAFDAIPEQNRIRRGCTLCGHKWTQHDPEDGRCDAHATEGLGPCLCGRDLAWMQERIAASSRDSRSPR